MQTFAFISRKGGVGKSMLTRQLAVLAGDVLLIDRDPQPTTTEWWNKRQEIKPTLVTPDLLTLKPTETLTEAVEALRAERGTLMIDTRPAVEEPEAEAARVADLVVVPLRATDDDVKAIGETLKMLERIKTRAVLVVNAAKNDARALETRARLSEHAFAVCPHHLTDRVVFQDAAEAGLGVSEMTKRDAREAEAELRRVWGWIRNKANG